VPLFWADETADVKALAVAASMSLAATVPVTTRPVIEGVVVRATTRVAAQR
jgi:hypothetical protein